MTCDFAMGGGGGSEFGAIQSEFFDRSFSFNFAGRIARNKQFGLFATYLPMDMRF
jgi:hypothetical protein